MEILTTTGGRLETGVVFYSSKDLFKTTASLRADEAEPLASEVIAQLSGYMVLSEGHKQAIASLAETLLKKVTVSSASGRDFIGLPTGFGKTTTLKCLVKHLYELSLTPECYPHPIGIAIERIEDVEAFCRDLIDNYDIPEEFVARIHSQLTETDISSLGCTSLDAYYDDLKHYPILIMTHAKLKANRFQEVYYAYTPNNVDFYARALIWDEEIVPSLLSTVDVKRLEGEIDRLLGRCRYELKYMNEDEDRKALISSS